VAAGNFFWTDAEDRDPLGAHYTDLIAIDVGLSSGPTVWPIHGVAFGVLDATVANNATQIGTCLGPADANTEMFCANGARYVTWPRASHDVVIGIDQPSGSAGRHLAVIDPVEYMGTLSNRPMMAVTFRTLAGLGITKDAGLSMRSLRIGNVDRDPEPELLITFGRTAETRNTNPNTGTVAVCDVDGNGIPTACTDVAMLPELAGLACADATPAVVTPSGPLVPAPALDVHPLLVVCQRDLEVPDPGNQGPDSVVTSVSEVYRLDHDGARFKPVYLAGLPGGIQVLQVGDVTGDGLDDLLGLRTSQMTIPSLVVIPQCASSDLLCLQPFTTTDEGMK
jgi:hypothetical protein